MRLADVGSLSLLVLVFNAFSSRAVDGLPFPGFVFHLCPRITAGGTVVLLDVITMPAASSAAYVCYLVKLTTC